MPDYEALFCPATGEVCPASLRRSVLGIVSDPDCPTGPSSHPADGHIPPHKRCESKALRSALMEKASKGIGDALAAAGLDSEFLADQQDENARKFMGG